MNVLFLDDDMFRKNRFRSEVPSATIISTAAECITELSKQEWDYVFLDHDLGGEVYADSETEDTGMEVVRWIEEHRPTIGRVIVHSFNPIAWVMRQRLTDCGYLAHRVPFGDAVFATLEAETAC